MPATQKSWQKAKRSTLVCKFEKNLRVLDEVIITHFCVCTVIYVCSSPPRDICYDSVQLVMLSIPQMIRWCPRCVCQQTVRYPSLALLVSFLHQGKCVMMPDLCCSFVFFKLFLDGSLWSVI